MLEFLQVLMEYSWAWRHRHSRWNIASQSETTEVVTSPIDSVDVVLAKGIEEMVSMGFIVIFDTEIIDTEAKFGWEMFHVPTWRWNEGWGGSHVLINC